MKLLHASNLRIGQGFPQLPDLASALREARLEAIRSILALATREKVSAIVLAGNTLADPRISHDLLINLTSLLATSTVPIYLRPGKTDPARADSPYVLRADLFQSPVHLLHQPQLPWAGPLVAVGESLPGAEYVALPDIISEPYDFGQGKGSVKLVSFPGAQVQEFNVSRHEWLEIESDSLSNLRSQLPPPSETTLLRVKLSGTTSLEEFQQFEQWRSSLRFQWFEVENRMQITGGKRFHHPLLRALQEKVEGSPDRTSARRALQQLDRLLSQSGKEDLV